MPPLISEIRMKKNKLSKIGADIYKGEMVHLLEALGFGVKNAGKKLKIDVPSHRSTGDVVNLSPADLLDYQLETTAFARMGANGWIDAFIVSSGQGSAERVGTVRVTEGFFPTLGVQPALGRLFAADEDLPGGARVVLLTDGFWRRRFGADPSIVGTPIMVNSIPATVIGVLPASFRHIEERTDRAPEMFMLYQFDQADPNRGGHFIRAIGRLRPIEAAGASKTHRTKTNKVVFIGFSFSNRL